MSETIAMLRGDIAQLRTEFGEMHRDVSAIRRDQSEIEARHTALESWRDRFVVQEDLVIGKLFGKTDELLKCLAGLQAELAGLRGERDAGQRVTMMIVGLLSAACGGLATSILQLIHR